MRARAMRVAALSLAALVAAPGISGATDQEQPPTTVTFSRDIAPILFEHCVVCHRPGAIGPMSLTSYREVRPWIRRIAEAVSARRMPPWKPEPGHGGPFIGERRLSDREVALITRWVADGAVEGIRADLPPTADWPAGGWRLGKPDLVIEMPPYTIPAGGRDVLRKFAIPISVGDTRYVTGVEFQPGNARVVHHANMRIDYTGASHALDQADPEAGYEGITPFGARFPPGYFLGWTPGQSRPLAPPEMAWRLDPGAEMLLELHLTPGTQPEAVQSRIGFYFTAAAPTRNTATIRLGRQNLDIPAGARDYVARDRYVLPVDVEVYGVQPHAHYLAREISGFATLPDGTRRWLISISDWDFDWQDFYQYQRPLILPKGTEITMEITYDNSSGNRRNPNSPPKRVTWGQSSSNEMGDLWLQVVPRSAVDLDILNQDRERQELAEDIVGTEMMLAEDPDQVMEHDAVALLYLRFGKVAQAVAHFRESARLQPTSATAQYNLGTALMRLGDVDEAIRHLGHALQLDPTHVQAHSSLGAALRLRGQTAQAIDHFRQALLIRPDDADALYNLASALAAQDQLEEAIGDYRRVLQVQPDARDALVDLAWLLAAHPSPRFHDPNEAVRLAERAARLTASPAPAALDALAAAYAAAGRFELAVATARAALAALPATASQSVVAASIRNRLDLYTHGSAYRGPR